ncbi:hypothetical protein [Cytophaga hutchinsonii]|uniref:Uncharacterized protein n=1 Tax=Cytophaga hutchinsonii (strain ATCC 33406 / DSM 1761 / CIP 103989 / NBRC 15051 / NCIMB 9469 / D465) TaxID=269798 RepID=A0A6N4SM60_CYTH3|nr:hypothetical protein [Cytophaga hutchinsonii]ABG57337.1 hypothetical protein CHU_0043 [Cytophaga hutchinsonii ATCC 33406]SFX46673.1 hypothetical protein SAMN04487930_104236 [Cytophaga hutchinsonii ATCC 33406]
MRSKSEILLAIKQQLEFVKDNLHDLKNNPNDAKIKRQSFANLITWGRTVTFVIQNLKSVVGEDKFNTWYQPFQDEMKNDQLLNMFKDARNNLEKQGKLHTSSIGLRNFSFDTSMLNNFQPPPNNKGFFIGDQFGGSGWIIELPDGSTEKIYVDMADIQTWTIEISFSNHAVMHLGQTVTDTSIENCSSLYYDYLKGLVEKTTLEFK